MQHQVSLLVVLEAMSLITDEKIACCFTSELLCVKPEGLIGHNQHLRITSLVVLSWRALKS